MSKTRKIRRARKARDRAMEAARSNETMAYSFKQQYDQLSEELEDINRQWSYHYNYMTNKFGPNSAMFEPVTIRSDRSIHEIPSFMTPDFRVYTSDKRPDMTATFMRLEKIRSEAEYSDLRSELSVHFFQENSSGCLTYCYSDQAKDMHSNPNLMKGIVRQLVESAIRAMTDRFDIGGWK